MFNKRIPKDVWWMNRNIFKQEYFESIKMALLQATN